MALHRIHRVINHLKSNYHPPRHRSINHVIQSSTSFKPHSLKQFTTSSSSSSASAAALHTNTSSQRQQQQPSAQQHPSWFNDVEKWCHRIHQHSQQHQITRISQLEADILHRFYATFNLPQFPYFPTLTEYHQHGIEIHPASHLAYFVNHTPTNLLASDGYESDYSPPSPFTLRMFAGGKIQYTLRRDKNTHRIRYPYIGDIIRKSSTLSEQPFIKHGHSGYLCFVSVKHEWCMYDSQEIALEEMQRYVYRIPANDINHEKSSNTRQANTSTSGSTVQTAGNENKSSTIQSSKSMSNNNTTRKYDIIRDDIILSEVLLFRYSALTWNAHQIHYDYNWARKEGYQHVLVHGPLQATILIDTIHTYIQKNSKGTLMSFEYRAMRPLVVNTPIQCVGWVSDKTKKSMNENTVEYILQIIPDMNHRNDNNSSGSTDGTPYMHATAVVQLQ